MATSDCRSGELRSLTLPARRGLRGRRLWGLPSLRAGSLWLRKTPRAAPIGAGPPPCPPGLRVLLAGLRVFARRLRRVGRFLGFGLVLVPAGRGFDRRARRQGRADERQGERLAGPEGQECGGGNQTQEVAGAEHERTRSG